MVLMEAYRLEAERVQQQWRDWKMDYRELGRSQRTSSRQYLRSRLIGQHATSYQLVGVTFADVRQAERLRCNLVLWAATQRKRHINENVISTPASSSLVAEHNSFLNQKPILKQRSMSETMLQKSLSATSLVKQAAAEIQGQQLRASGRGSDYSGRGPTTSDCVTFPSLSIFASTAARSSKCTGNHPLDRLEEYGYHNAHSWSEVVWYCASYSVLSAPWLFSKDGIMRFP